MAGKEIEMLHARDDYNRIQDPAGLIPQDEPVFLLRAKDACAIPALHEWLRQASKFGVEPHMIQAAVAQINRMIDWQDMYGAKVPDMPAPAA